MSKPDASSSLVVITPEAAATIRLGRQASGLTVALAAARARIALSRWKQIEAGYERRRGRNVEVRLKPETLAWVAYAAQIRPAERLEASPFTSQEAARILREIIRREDEEIPGSFRRLAAHDHDPDALWSMESVRRIWELTALTENERWGIILSLLDDLADDPPAAADRARRRALPVATVPRSHTPAGPAVPRPRTHVPARPVRAAAAAAAR